MEQPEKTSRVNPQKRAYKFRALSELSLIDNFLFGLYIQEASAEDIKELLECLLGMGITEIDVFQKQRSILNDPETHAVVLDAFVKDIEGNIYNIEVQASRIKNVPKRMRFYQAMIDKERLPSGSFKYESLPKTIIIFVTDYDVFDKGLYRYTFKNTCLEDGSVQFGDDTLKIVLNTKGKVNVGVSDELIELLRYFSSSTDETAESAVSEYVKRLNDKLKPIKNNSKFGDDFMSLQEMIFHEKEESWEEGRAEGRAEGEAKGRAEGEAKGRAEGEAKGRAEGMSIGEIIGTIKAYLKMGKSPDEIIADIINDYSLSHEKAEEYVKQCCPAT